MMGFVLVFLCMTSFGIWQLIPHHAIQSHGTAFIIDGIAYESNNDPIAIYELADITTHGITGEGTQESPYLIENRIINIADNNIGIYIYLNAVYRIRNCIINGGMYGIRMQYGQDSIVEHCLIANAYYGINTDTTTQNITIQYCRVVNGTLYGNPPPSPYSQGYRIEGSSNLIQHNSVESCIAGIVSTASYTNITNNTALFNQDSGIQAWGSYVYIENNTASYNGKVASTFTNAGIVGTVSHSVIQNNTCHYNLAYGLAIWSSGYNVTLRINVLQHNYYAGIIVRYSTVMNLTYNNITDSNYGIVILGIYNDQIHATYNNITNMFYAGFQLQGIKHSIFASNYLGNVSSGFYHEYLG